MSRPLADCTPPRVLRALLVEVLLLAAGAALAQLSWSRDAEVKPPPPVHETKQEKKPERKVRVVRLPKPARQQPEPAPAPAPTLIAKAEPAPAPKPALEKTATPQTAKAQPTPPREIAKAEPAPQIAKPPIAKTDPAPVAKVEPTPAPTPPMPVAAKPPTPLPTPAPIPEMPKAATPPPVAIARAEIPVKPAADAPPLPVAKASPPPTHEPARPRPVRIAADSREVHGVRLRVLVPSSPEDLASHLHSSGGCLVVSRLDGQGAEVLSVLGLESSRAVEVGGPPCAGVPRLLNDASLNLALGDPLGRAQAEHPGEHLALQVLLSPQLPGLAQEALRAHFGDLPDDELARRAADAGYELTCFAEPEGSVRCE